MRRSLGYVAMGMILIGGAIVALSEESWPSNAALEPLLSLLAPSRVHAAPAGTAQADDDGTSAYFAEDDEIKPASSSTPATHTSSRRTQLDARFEDMSLSLSEDEPEEFRTEMGPTPAVAAKAPQLALPEEPTHAAMATDEFPSTEPVETTPAPRALTPLAAAPDSVPTSVEPAAATPADQDRYDGFSQFDVAESAPSTQPMESEPTPVAHEAAAEVAPTTVSPPAEIATQQPEVAESIEATPAPFAEPRRLSRPGLTQTPPTENSIVPGTPAFATTPASNDDGQEIPAWNGAASEPSQHEVFAAAPSENDKHGTGAVTVHWLTPGEVNRGDEIPCRLQVTNHGDTPAVSVAVHIELPEHAVLSGASAKATGEGRQLSWKLDRLEPQESKTFELRLMPQGEGDFAPTASVTYTRAATANIHVLDPQLAVSIEGPEQALVSQPAVYQLRVSNPGTGKARNVVVQARLDAKLSHPSGADLEYSIGTLGPGETRLLEVPVTGTTPGEGNILAEATSANRLSAQGGCVVEIVRPALELAIEGPKLRFVDRKATFTLTAYNPGAVAATNVQLFGSVPAGYKYEGATAGGGFDESMGAVTWFIGRLEPQATVKVEYELVAHDLGTHRLLAMARADLGVEERTELETIVDGVPSVALEMSSPDAPIEIGGQATYRIEVTNRGTKDATNVQVACRVPVEMEAADAQGATAGAISGDRIVFEPLATLAPGETKVYNVIVTCHEAADVRFRAFFRSNECREVVQQEALTRIYQD